jgi:hypothetical protein
MALGAQREGVLWTVLCQGMRTVALGLALGLLAAVANSRLLSGLLYGRYSGWPSLHRHSGRAVVRRIYREFCAGAARDVRGSD